MTSFLTTLAVVQEQLTPEQVESQSRSVMALPDALGKDELHAITIGKLPSSANGLLALTDKRLVLVGPHNKSAQIYWELPIDAIDSIRYLPDEGAPSNMGRLEGRRRRGFRKTFRVEIEAISDEDSFITRLSERLPTLVTGSTMADEVDDSGVKKITSVADRRNGEPQEVDIGNNLLSDLSGISSIVDSYLTPDEIANYEKCVEYLQTALTGEELLAVTVGNNGPGGSEGLLILTENRIKLIKRSWMTTSVLWQLQYEEIETMAYTTGQLSDGVKWNVKGRKKRGLSMSFEFNLLSEMSTERFITELRKKVPSKESEPVEEVSEENVVELTEEDRVDSMPIVKSWLTAEEIHAYSNCVEFLVDELENEELLAVTVGSMPQRDVGLIALTDERIMLVATHWKMTYIMWKLSLNEIESVKYTIGQDSDDIKGRLEGRKRKGFIKSFNISLLSKTSLDQFTSELAERISLTEVVPSSLDEPMHTPTSITSSRLDVMLNESKSPITEQIEIPDDDVTMPTLDSFANILDQFESTDVVEEHFELLSELPRIIEPTELIAIAIGERVLGKDRFLLLTDTELVIYTSNNQLGIDLMKIPYDEISELTWLSFRDSSDDQVIRFEGKNNRRLFRSKRFDFDWPVENISQETFDLFVQKLKKMIPNLKKKAIETESISPQPIPSSYSLPEHSISGTDLMICGDYVVALSQIGARFMETDVPRLAPTSSWSVNVIQGRPVYLSYYSRHIDWLKSVSYSYGVFTREVDVPVGGLSVGLTGTMIDNFIFSIGRKI